MISESAMFLKMGSTDVVYQLGMHMLQTNLRTYARYIMRGTSSRSQAVAISQSLAFVQGSGLETVIKWFNFDADADTLRETLHDMIAWQSRHS
mgnify:CR=1 FL=1